MEEILYIAHTDTGGNLGRQAREALNAALVLAPEGKGLAVAVFGRGAAAALQTLGGCGAGRYLVAEAAELEDSRYATDVAAIAALVDASGAAIVVGPGTARFRRSFPGAAQRCGGRVDTQVTAMEPAADGLRIQRWYYRQRMVATLARASRPWLVLTASGAFAPWSGTAAAVDARPVAVEAASRTRVLGVETPEADSQTIRPEADVLLVAGAGWTKKQADGQTHAAQAEQLIREFLERAQASLGSSKSLVDLSSEGEEVLSVFSHLNQVGQTGMAPRHSKGLATCCHGEEPHTVGWRFINERRAINLDPNCGWAQGKADVLYVADAFEVLARVNALLTPE